MYFGMKKFYAIYLKANVHIFLICSIFCVPYTTVSDADNAFFERRLDRIKLTFFMISRFVDYRCHFK